jgi:hypothetical protein
LEKPAFASKGKKGRERERKGEEVRGGERR